MKIKRKENIVEFRYCSPLKDKTEGAAKQIAELAEQSMLEIFDIMLQVIEVRANLFYSYAEKQIQEMEKQLKETKNDNGPG